MSDETQPASGLSGPSAHQRRPDGTDFIRAALDFVRGVSPTGGGALGTPTPASQEKKLREWADRYGLWLDHATIIARLSRGGQEHDFFREGERVFKVTRNGVFGLSPGIELALVSSSLDARRFHL